jgi:hypothetical protein
MGGAPNWFPSLLQFLLCNWDLLSGTPGEASPSIWSTGQLAPGGMLSRWAWNAESVRQKGENTSESQISIYKCYGNLEQRHKTPRLFGKQCLLACWQQLNRFISKGWAPRTKGLPLYTFASGLQKQKASFNTYMATFNSISYFTLSATWPSSFLDF